MTDRHTDRFDSDAPDNKLETTSFETAKDVLNGLRTRVLTVAATLPERTAAELRAAIRVIDDSEVERLAITVDFLFKPREHFHSLKSTTQKGIEAASKDSGGRLQIGDHSTGTIKPEQPVTSERDFQIYVKKLMQTHGVKFIDNPLPAQVESSYLTARNTALTTVSGEVEALFASAESNIRDPQQVMIAKRELIDRIITDFATKMGEKLGEIERSSAAIRMGAMVIGKRLSSENTNRLYQIYLLVDEISAIRLFNEQRLSPYSGILEKLGVIPAYEQVRAKLQAIVNGYPALLNDELNKISSRWLEARTSAHKVTESGRPEGQDVDADVNTLRNGGQNDRQIYRTLALQFGANDEGYLKTLNQKFRAKSTSHDDGTVDHSRYN